MALVLNYLTTTSSGDLTPRTEIKSLLRFPGKVHCSGLCLDVHEDAQKVPRGFFSRCYELHSVNLWSHPLVMLRFNHSPPVVMFFNHGFSRVLSFWIWTTSDWKCDQRCGDWTETSLSRINYMAQSWQTPMRICWASQYFRERLSTRLWSVEILEQLRSFKDTSITEVRRWCCGRNSGVHSAFQFISNEFGGVEVTASLTLDKRCLHRAQFGQVSIYFCSSSVYRTRIRNGDGWKTTKYYYCIRSFRSVLLCFFNTFIRREKKAMDFTAVTVNTVHLLYKNNAAFMAEWHNHAVTRNQTILWHLFSACCMIYKNNDDRNFIPSCPCPCSNSEGSERLKKKKNAM